VKDGLLSQRDERVKLEHEGPFMQKSFTTTIKKKSKEEKGISPEVHTNFWFCLLFLKMGCIF